MEIVIPRGGSLPTGSATADNQIIEIDRLTTIAANQDDQTAILTEIEANQVPGHLHPADYQEYSTPAGGTGLERRVLLYGNSLFGLDVYLSTAVTDAKFALIFDTDTDADPAPGAIPSFPPIPLLPGMSSCVESSPETPYRFVLGILVTLSLSETYAATSSTEQARYRGRTGSY